MPDIPKQIADLRLRPWAIRGELMPAVREALLHRPTAAEAEALKALEAGPRDPNITPGGVAVLPLHGMIRPGPSLLSLLFGYGGGGLLGFRQTLRELLGNDDVTAIVIDVDSPGGLADLVAETAAELRAAKGKKPIASIANTMCCSAAYWIASQADEVVITPSGFAGSIGVYTVHDDYSVALENAGIKPTYIKAGKHKAEANPDEPLSDEAQEHLQEMVDDCYASFVADVAKGRGVSTQAVKSGFGEARTLTAKACVEEGIADRIATFEELVGELASGRSSVRARALSTPPASSSDQPPAAIVYADRKLVRCSECEVVDGAHATECRHADEPDPFDELEPEGDTKPDDKPADNETGEPAGPEDEPGDEPPADEPEPEEEAKAARVPGWYSDLNFGGGKRKAATPTAS